MIISITLQVNFEANIYNNLLNFLKYAELILGARF